jgi:hypothetical protein
LLGIPFQSFWTTTLAILFLTGNLLRFTGHDYFTSPGCIGRRNSVMYSGVLKQDFDSSRDGMAVLHGGWGKTRKTVFRFSGLSGEFGGDRLHFLIFHRPGKFGAQPVRIVSAKVPGVRSARMACPH